MFCFLNLTCADNFIAVSSPLVKIYGEQVLYQNFLLAFYFLKNDILLTQIDSYTGAAEIYRLVKQLRGLLGSSLGTPLTSFRSAWKRSVGRITLL